MAELYDAGDEIQVRKRKTKAQLQREQEREKRPLEHFAIAPGSPETEFLP